MIRPVCLALICFWLLALAGVAVCAERDNEKQIRERLARNVHLCMERNSLQGYLQQLSNAIELPIDFDLRSIQLEGITLSSSRPIPCGIHPACHWLELILYKFNFQRKLNFLVTEDPDQRTPLGVRVLVTTHEYIRRASLILPPGFSEEADRAVYERLTRRVTLPAGQGVLANQLELLGKAIELPIELEASLLHDERLKAPDFEIAPREQTALLCLRRLLEPTGPERALSYAIAYDNRERLPQRIRLVVAKRTMFANNVARFTPPKNWPIANHPDVDRVLQRPITLAISNTTWNEVVWSLAHQAKVEITLDDAEIEKAGLVSHSLVSIDVRGQPFGTVLKQLLDDVDGDKNVLAFVTWRVPIEGAVLCITPRPAIAANHWELPSIFSSPVD